MTRGKYLSQGAKRRGRAGWIEHQQEDTPRHAVAHDPPARPALPMRPLDEEETAPQRRRTVVLRATEPAETVNA